MNDELKKADEVVRALRDYASDCDSDSEYCFQCTFAWVCDKFDNNAPKIIADLIESLTAQLSASQRREKAAVETLTAIFEHIDSDEYLRKEFCVHPGREDCPSEAANGYVDVDDCCGCPLFVNSYSGPQEAEKGEADGK